MTTTTTLCPHCEQPININLLDSVTLQRYEVALCERNTEIARLRDVIAKIRAGLVESACRLGHEQPSGAVSDETIAITKGVRWMDWLCFHCGFQTSDHREAASHFGDSDDERPLCVTWSALNAEGKASEYQSALRELNAERDENLVLKTKIEGLEYRLSAFENLLYSRFPNCRTLDQAFNMYDSMEGRALAAEERLAVHRGRWWRNGRP